MNKNEMQLQEMLDILARRLQDAGGHLQDGADAKKVFINTVLEELDKVDICPMCEEVYIIKDAHMCEACYEVNWHIDELEKYDLI